MNRVADSLCHQLGIVVLVLLMCGFVLPANVLGQYGASPSQTGMFFDDLRNRATNSTLGTSSESGVRSGEAVYDYENGVYRDNQGPSRQMGYTVSSLNEAARQMGQPAYQSASMAFAARSVGDYSVYAGQYSAPNTFFAPTYVSDPFMGGRRNLKVGGLNVGLGVFGSVEYNDNVTRASKDPVEDIIGTMFLNVDANYQLTQYNQLSLRTTLGFDHYFMNPEVAPFGSEGFVLNVLPGSTVSFEIKAGPVFIVLYDRFSVRPAVQNDFGLAFNQIFGVFQNDVGFAALWDINSELSLSVNFMHSNARALEDEYEIFDRDMDSLHAKLTWTPSGTWSTGIEGGVSSVRYPQNFNNDGLLSNVGVFFATPLGDSSVLRVAGGYQTFDFDSPPEIDVSQSSVESAERAATTAARTLTQQQEKLNTLTRGTVEFTEQERAIEEAQADFERKTLEAQTLASRRQQQLESNTQDASSLSDYYFNLVFTNQLSSRVSQVLSLGHESALGNISNFITADYITYGIGIIAWRGSRLSISTYYEDAEMSGGRLAENLEQYGIDFYVSHTLNSWCRFGGGYHFGVTDSNLPGRDFDQHSFTLDVSIAVTRRSSLSLGYRFFNTKAEDPDFSFDQNRFVVAFNYNF